jgi:hypothetical protein
MVHPFLRHPFSHSSPLAFIVVCRPFLFSFAACICHCLPPSLFVAHFFLHFATTVRITIASNVLMLMIHHGHSEAGIGAPLLPSSSAPPGDSPPGAALALVPSPPYCDLLLPPPMPLPPPPPPRPCQLDHPWIGCSHCHPAPPTVTIVVIMTKGSIISLPPMIKKHMYRREKGSGENTGHDEQYTIRHIELEWVQVRLRRRQAP